MSTATEGSCSGMKRVLLVTMVDIEKRYIPVKHYVYIMDVKWSDGSKQTIFRKYSDFFDFHVRLAELFPEETGQYSEKCRIIPTLTGKKKWREEVRHSAMKRKVALEEYCKILINLDPRISQHEIVINFFRQIESDRTPAKDIRTKPRKSRMLTALGLFSSNPEKEDINSSMSSLSISKPIESATYKAIADYQSLENDQISFDEDDLVQVIEKNNDGWWLIQIDNVLGWAPASFLQPCDEITEPDEPPPLYNYEQYLAVEDYSALLPDEVTMQRGAIVNVMHKLLDGWWIVHLNGQVGYVPATYLVPFKPRVPGQAKPTKEQMLIENLTLVSSIVGGKQIRKPSQRRCTINRKQSDKTHRSDGKDLVMYRKMSIKMNHQLSKTMHS